MIKDEALTVQEEVNSNNELEVPLNVNEEVISNDLEILSDVKEEVILNELEVPLKINEEIISNELEVPLSDDRVATSDTNENDGEEIDQETGEIDTQPLVEEMQIIGDPIANDEIPRDSHVDILIIDQNEINEEDEELLSDKEIKSVQKELEGEEYDDNDDVVVSPQRDLSADLLKPTKTGDSTKDEVSLS